MEKIIIHKFNTVAEYVSYLDTTPYNPKFSCRSSSNEDTRHVRFTGTKSYDEAQELLENGDKKLAKQLEKKSGEVGKNIKNLVEELIAKRKRDIVGSMPNVAAFLSNNPRNMIRKTRVKAETKIINLVYLNQIHCTVRKEAMIEAGTNMLYCLRELERAGYRVNLYVGQFTWVTSSCSKPWGYVVNVKNSGQYINIEKLAYIMANPSAYRRHGFRMMEVEKDVVFSSYYGFKMDDKKVINEMLQSVNINNATVLTFYDVEGKTAKDTCDMVTGYKRK